MTTTADVCLIVEGTYPFVTGGVSAWLDQLIRALPELRFAILHIAATEEARPPLAYTLPPNVTDMRVIGVHGGRELARSGARVPPEAWEEVRTFHDAMIDGRGELGALLRVLAPTPESGPTPHDFIHGKSSWGVVRALYEARAPSVSFIDYFWTYRFTHLPIFRLMRIEVPLARVYHTVSTGWAGLAAAIVRARTGRPMLLTEHGIYSRERRMEIDQAEWIYAQRQAPMSLSLGGGFFKELWARLFARLSFVTYTHADLIVTIFEGNRRAQIDDGADPQRTLVVPNGIDVERFASLPRESAGPGTFRVGLVGRVVPIKDVKTFIRAVRIVTESAPGTTAKVVGPTDEDPEYVAECQALVASLGLQERVEFTGRADVSQHYPRLDVVVLTSVSEGLPLVILEASAAGIPVVASDVGACRELLEGRTPDDRALGPSGLVTGIADPGDTATALLALARDPGLREEMGQAGRARVRTHYQETDLVRRYRDIYDRLLAMPAAS